jgi:hypothetical protein
MTQQTVRLTLKEYVALQEELRFALETLAHQTSGNAAAQDVIDALKRQLRVAWDELSEVRK